ncbi:MAG: PcfJ domain-containing protein [Bacteroidetes bacterium]|nr:PcfJ domain-containing protein [Bacteroidota bacterium]MCB0851502.1 PcfJ domain-containing protein [Bacteroidota bacterium]
MKRKQLAEANAKQEIYFKKIFNDAKIQYKENTKISELLGVPLAKRILLNSEHHLAIDRIKAQISKAIRPIDNWKPLRTRRPEPLIKHLGRYLFAQYHLPKFLDHVWFEDNLEFQNWYLKLGKGINIRNLNTPLDYTKKMSHYFMQAPDHLTVRQALRWGQILGLGGDRRLADTITSGHLGTNLVEDDFWSTVIIFMKNQPMLDPSLINPIIDYIYHQKFHGQRRLTNYHTYEFIPPPTPGFSMKGRTITSLIRGMEKWHRELREVKYTGKNISWIGSRKKDWEYIEGVGNGQKCYQIIQLKSALELIEEGRAMKHCVASYAYSCSKGNCSIWSLRVNHDFSQKPLVTIEVNARDMIVQARGKYNAMPSQVEQNIIRRWAVANDLKTQYIY